jgi:hypothetical protein
MSSGFTFDDIGDFAGTPTWYSEEVARLSCQIVELEQKRAQLPAGYVAYQRIGDSISRLKTRQQQLRGIAAKRYNRAKGLP